MQLEIKFRSGAAVSYHREPLPLEKFNFICWIMIAIIGAWSFLGFLLILVH